MTAARKNRAMATRDDDLTPSAGYVISDAEMERGRKARKAWTWDANQPIRMTEWPDYGDLTLIQCGFLVRVSYRSANKLGGPGKTHPLRAHDDAIELDRSVILKSHLAYDLNDNNQRLYILLPPEVRVQLKEKLWDKNPTAVYSLGSLSAAIGGRHGRRDSYPNIAVKPLGLFTTVVYYTHKESDGHSCYLHKMAEESHVYPMLAIDAQGRLWVAGGNYTCPVQGITD